MYIANVMPNPFWATLAQYRTADRIRTAIPAWGLSFFRSGSESIFLSGSVFPIRLLQKFFTPTCWHLLRLPGGRGGQRRMEEYKRAQQVLSAQHILGGSAR